MLMASIYITYYLLNRLDELSHGKNLSSIPPREQDIMARRTSNVKGVLADLLAPILPKTGGEPTREALINLH